MALRERVLIAIAILLHVIPVAPVGLRRMPPLSNTYAGRGTGPGRYRLPYEFEGDGDRQTAPARHQARHAEATATGQGCDVRYIVVKLDIGPGASGGEAGPPANGGDKGGGEGLAYNLALYHVGFFTGLEQVQYCTLANPHPEALADVLPATATHCREDHSLQGMMMRPLNLPVRDVDTHFFSCMDGRAEYALLGTPGGDLGEFVRAVQAVERLTYRLIEPDEVDWLFRRFVESMSSAGRKYFAMCTDAPAEAALHKAARVAMPLNPLDQAGRRRLIQLAAKPEHIGSSLLKAIVENPAEYETRKSIVEAALQSFAAIHRDWTNPLRENLLPIVLRGERKDAAVLKVSSPETCFTRVPLVVPRVHSITPTAGGDMANGAEAGAGAAAFVEVGEAGGEAGAPGTGPAVGASVMVYHYAAANFFRQRLGEFMAEAYKDDVRVNPVRVQAKLNAMGQLHFEKQKAAAAAGKPEYVVRFVS